ncbi:ubiquinol-cytochrome C chaperone family protein [Aliidiomarina quisquiliarum]|uniref:ubiquinol-cytochrome C chaperone family protein n=1 Tax=Aliidiomarina quisquiliarum TaxID=2938947 RepID=UPI00208F418F|nr:ubiquinol-cytochrome C chaperone family protein [Aliidiomarina quisquiliarum]MCO4320676.1 hypothetical protein [Aliidiomarina quisquiliarum]
MKNTSIFDKDLNPVLEIASDEDLETLVDYLKTKLSETLTTHESYKLHEPSHSEYADLIAKEIRDMGGNSFANLFRGSEGPSYHEIVCDVAKQLKVPFNKDKDIEDIENAIFETVLTEALDKMSDEDRLKLMDNMGAKGRLNKGGIATSAFIAIFRSGGFYSYQLTAIIANQIAKLILGRGLMLATNASIMRVASILTGPIGLAITGLWAAIDIAGPAYKVTIPCVIHIAMLRKKLNAINCDNCDAMLSDITMKFCPDCGNKVST